MEFCGLVIKEVLRVPDEVLGELNMVLINIKEVFCHTHGKARL